jgi:hypothetical protein
MSLPRLGRAVCGRSVVIVVDFEGTSRSIFKSVHIVLSPISFSEVDLVAGC